MSFGAGGSSPSRFGNWARGTGSGVILATSVLLSAGSATAQTVGGTGGSGAYACGHGSGSFGCGGAGGTSGNAGQNGSGGASFTGGGGGGGGGPDGGAGGAGGTGYGSGGQGGDGGTEGGASLGGDLTGGRGADGTGGQTAGSAPDLGEGGGGGGGAGGYGAVVTGGTNNNTVTGGTGGTGGDGGNGGGNGGGGGGGGAGIVLTTSGAQLTNNQTITGGNGGSGGKFTNTTGASGYGGAGGNGGAGVLFNAGGSFTNTGSVTGGAGGSGGAGQGYSFGCRCFVHPSAASGAGGAGVVGSNLTIINSSSITGGGGAPAIDFTGGDNTLTLQDGWTLTGAVNVATGSLKFNQSINVTLANQIVGGGSIIQDGTGTLTLSAANNYSGGTTVAAGTLELTNNSAAGGGTITLDAGTTLHLDGVQIGNEVSVVGDPDIAVTGANSMSTLSGASTATVNILGTDNSAATDVLILTGANGTYAGTTNVGGTAAGSSVTLQGAATDAFGSASSVSIFTGSVLDLGGFDQAIGSLSGGGTVTNSGTGSAPNVLTIDGGGTSTFSGVIEDGTEQVGLTLSGTGSKLILTNTNTYTGGTTIGSGSTLQLGDGTTNGSIVGNVTDDGTFAIDTATGTTVTYAGAISGTGAVTVIGTGKTMLTGSNTYHGATTIGDGTHASELVGGATNAFSANSAFTVNAASTLDLGGFDQTIGALAGAGTVTNNGTAATTNTLTIDGGSATTFSGTIEDGTAATALTLTGAGTDLTLSHTSTYSGAATIGDGTNASKLIGGAANAFSANSAFTVEAASTLDLGGFDQTISSLAGAGIVTNGGTSGGNTLTIAGGTATAFSGTIEDGNAATTALTLTGAGTALMLSGSNTYSGATTIGDGTHTSELVGGAADAFSANSAFTVTAASALDLGGFDQKIFSLAGAGLVTNNGTANTTNMLTIDGGTATTFSGSIEDGSARTALTLTGAGTDLTLSGGNNYSGATTIGDGTHASKLIGGAENAFSANSAFTVEAASTLDLGGFDQTIGSLAGTGTVTNGGASGGNMLVIDGGTATTFGGAIEDGATATTALGLIGNGTGLTLTGTNTYSGVTIIGDGTNASTLTAGSADVFSANSAFAVNTASTLDLDGFGQTIMSLAGGGTVTNGGSSGTAILTIGNGDGANFSGIIEDGPNAAIALTLTAGTQTLSGTNTYSGPTTINGGTLALSGTGSIASSSVALASSGTFDISALTDGGAIIVSLSGQAGTVMLGGNTLTLSNASGTYGGSIDGTGGLTLAAGTETLTGSNSYSGTTTVDGGATLVAGAANALSAASTVMLASGGVLDLNGFDQTVGSLAGSGDVTLGAVTLTAGGNNLNTAFSGTISGSGGLTKIGSGTLTLSGTDGYTGQTNVNEGTLEVDGTIADSSSVNVSSGATLTGIGTVDPATTTISGTLAPGNSANPTGTLTITGNLAFQSGAIYLVQVTPTTAASTAVTGTASLAGTVNATFAAGNYISKQYTVLTASSISGSFASSVVNSNMPADIHDTLSYDATHVYLDLALNYQPPAGSLSGNQQNISGALTDYFNATGGIPMKFATLSAASLTKLDGEDSTDAEHGAFDLMNEFMSLLLDPSLNNRGGPPAPGGDAAPASSSVSGFAAEDQTSLPPDAAHAYADAMKLPPPPATFAQRWTAWGTGFGGTASSDGNAAAGSNNVTATTYGYAGGMDYHVSPGTLMGFAVAGGGTNWNLAQSLGSGRSDAVQGGVYAVSHDGPAYIAVALAFANDWFTTNRISLGDQLKARFDGQSYGGRLEGGYRFAIPVIDGTFGITPYAAVQVQDFRTPAYSETDLTGGGFGLSYAAMNGLDTRSEVGSRFDSLTAIASMPLLLSAKAAWAHDWVSNPSLNASFETLPGTSFTVFGAPVPHDSAIASAGAQLFFTSAWSFLAKFDGGFASGAQSYAGSGTLRYTW